MIENVIAWNCIFRSVSSSTKPPSSLHVAASCIYLYKLREGRERITISICKPVSGFMEDFSP